MRTMLNLAAAAALLAAHPAFATLQNYSFEGTLDSGHYVGQTFSGSFSYDDAGLFGVADEWLGLSGLNMNFLGQTYTAADGVLAPEVAFLDGALLGLSFSVSSGEPQFSLVAGSVDIGEAFIAYDTPLGASGAGNVIYAAVPEPGTYSMMLAGLGLLGYSLRRKGLRA